MNDRDYELKELCNELEFEKISRQLHKMDRIDEVRDIALAFCKLYLRQKEAFSDTVKTWT